MARQLLASPGALALGLVGLMALCCCAAGQALVAEGDVLLRTEDVQRRNLVATNFTFDFAAAGDNTTNGNVRAENVNGNAALATLPQEGVSQALVTLGPCAINQPHVHPRGTEVAFVTKGSLVMAFLEENPSAALGSGGRRVANTVEKGNSFIFPQGLMHYAINLGCEEAQFVASFPTLDPGTQTIMSRLFDKDVPTEVLRATTGLSDGEIQNIRTKVAANPNPSADAECLKKCSYRRRRLLR